MVTPEERAALLKYAKPLKPQGPDLIVTCRLDLYSDRLLEQNDKGGPRELWWKRYDKVNNRVVLAFGPRR